MSPVAYIIIAIVVLLVGIIVTALVTKKVAVDSYIKSEEQQLGSAQDRAKQIVDEALKGSQDSCCRLGKDSGLDPAVIGNGNRWGLKICVYIIRKSLSCPADGVNVQPVAARTDYTPQTAGAEGQIPIKAILDGICVVCNLFELYLKIRIIYGLLTPKVI